MWLAFEHEIMHLETYLYMLLQSAKALPPPGSRKPDFEELDAKAELHSVPNQWFRVPKKEFKIGLEDPENDLGPDRYFGWDNEKPSRYVSVSEFETQGRPISNGEYATYLQETHSTAIPASWTVDESRTKCINGSISDSINGSISDSFNGSISESSSVMGSTHDQTYAKPDFLKDISVRTVYGPIPLKYARHWPVMASYDELAAYAKWSDGRIPTLEEARSIYSYVEDTKLEVEGVSSSLISAVNG
jgi:L-histidine Nalpha-methyltransferase / hercynylcysteine S-oxide synthase